MIINAVKVDQNFLIDAYISEFNEEFRIKRNIVSPRIDISKKIGYYMMQKFLIEIKSKKFNPSN